MVMNEKLSDEKSNVIEVDLLYESIYELQEARWNFDGWKKILQAFESTNKKDGSVISQIRFQPRAYFIPRILITPMFINKNCIENGKYCVNVPLKL